MSDTIQIIEWQGCYDDSWDTFIVPEAFAHPAKFARGLIAKIYVYMLAQEMLRPGDVVVDPFGGIGCGGIVAASWGLQWVGCELEEKFVALGQQNIALHRRTWESFKDPIPVLVRGDSRKLRENLQGIMVRGGILGGTLADCCVSSPPFSTPDCQPIGSRKEYGGQTVRKNYARDGLKPEDTYGQTPGQLGAMKPGDVAAVVSSPPYSGDSEKCDRTGDERARRRAEETGYRQGLGCFKTSEAYGRSDGQLGGLPTGHVDSVITSPPYAEVSVAKNSKGIDRRKQWETYRSQGGGMSYEAFAAQQERHSGDYGSSDGQLSRLPAGQVDSVVSSPPYAETLTGDNTARETAEESRAKRVTEGGSLGQSCRHQGYGGPGNLGNLKAGAVDSVVTSPPYEGIRQDGGRIAQEGVGGFGAYTDEPADYWHTQRDQNNLGNLKTGETFWGAAAMIVAECYAILKPGGWSAWVCKDFVRNKARVPFCDDWCRLLESQGFVVTTRVHAMLVKETSHPDLFGGADHVRTKERKSFFRRLAEKKGSPRIDFEEVLFARKPA